MPDSVRREEFIKFAEDLDQDRQTPSWLGLPNNAEKVLLTNLGTDMIAKLMKVYFFLFCGFLR